MENKQSSFWKAYNSSRCKTAMLIISLIVFTGVVASELLGHPSDFLKDTAVIIVGYWAGRSTKSNDKSDTDNWKN